MIKEGDLVSRNSHNNDIVFVVEKIIDDIAYLKGYTIRLCADANLSDLVIYKKELKEDIRFYNYLDTLKKSERDNYFYIPGKILHIDGDENYLSKSMNFYKKANVLAIGIYSKEDEIIDNIINYLEDINPDIVVITGHDSRTKNNSKYFADAVKICRKYQRDYDKLIIIAGACQSDYELLLKSGANFASSPKRVNIHALDPALIAISLSLLEKSKELNLIELLNKTSNGIDGIGGVNTKGVLRKGYPK